MLVAELIAKLKKLDPSAEVYLSFGYGDRLRTTVAEEVTTVEEQKLTWSNYHESYRVPDDDFDDSKEDENEDHPNISAVVLS